MPVFLVCCSDSWDSICTAFFIDTAHNVIKYIETIWAILKPGGFWINIGEHLSLLCLIIVSVRNASKDKHNEFLTRIF